MSRVIELKQGALILKENKVKGFLERTVNSIGTSAKVDVPKRFIGNSAIWHMSLLILPYVAYSHIS